MPFDCAEELGGIISMAPDSDDYDLSWEFTANIIPRVTGVHYFWLNSNDGSRMFMDDVEVIDNGIQTYKKYSYPYQQGSIFLRKGVSHTMRVQYGTTAAGVLELKWSDPLATKPMKSLLPILGSMHL